MAKKLRVLILGGGPSSEHEISLKTAAMVHQHLDRKKYEPKFAIVDRYGKWVMPRNVDVAFIAMHGEFGEDGQAQKILEEVKIPYTGSGVSASALGMDKLKSQALFASHGFNVPKIFDLPSSRAPLHYPAFPVVIKPTDRGSSVGVSIVRKQKDLDAALKTARAVSKNIMAQEFIAGTELTCGVLDDGKNHLTPLFPTEIVPKLGNFFDYKSKYSESGSEEITPARVPAKILHEAQDIALRAHALVGCSGFSRTDMIWSRERSKIYILEINTIPGLTAQSLLPKAALASGISFPKLLGRIIKAALAKATR